MRSIDHSHLRSPRSGPLTGVATTDPALVAAASHGSARAHERNGARRSHERLTETTSKLELPRPGDAVLLSVDGLVETLACTVVGLTATTVRLAPHVARLDDLRAAGRAAAVLEWNTRHGRARLSARIAMRAIDGSAV